MKKHVISNAALASVIALTLAAGAAYAESQITNGAQNNNHPGVHTGMTADDSKETRNAKSAMIKADNALRRGADEIRAFLSGDDPNAPLKSVVISRDSTAEAMLDAEVVDAAGKKVATVDDILLDDNGHPTKVVVSQGGFMGVGEKKASVDYGNVKAVTKADGTRIVTGLTEAAIKQAPQATEPSADHAKVSEILDGAILDSKDAKVADIENVAFGKDGTQLIVKFNDTFGLGGNFAAMNLSKLERVDTDGEVSYRLSDAQTAQFRNYKASIQ